MAEAARLLSDQTGLHFVFCGNAAGKAELVRQADGVPNVLFLHLQPMDRLNDLLGMADIHLPPQLLPPCRGKVGMGVVRLLIWQP